MKSLEERSIEISDIFKEFFGNPNEYEEPKRRATIIQIGPLSPDAAERLQDLFAADPIFKDDLYTPAPVGARSDTEFKLCARLWEAGFSETEIYAIMSSSQQTKWLDRNDSYRWDTLRKAVAQSEANRRSGGAGDHPGQKEDGGREGKISDEELEASRKILADLKDRLKDDPGAHYEPEIYEALKQVYHNDPQEWARVKGIFRATKTSIRDFLSSLEEDQDETPIIETPFVELENGKIAEMVVQGGMAKFAIYDPSTGDIKYVPAIELDGTKIIPPISDEIFLKGYVVLPSMAEEYGDEMALYEEIKDFVHSHLEVSPDYEEIAGFYPMLTWVYDVMSVIAYLRAKGDWGVGKSRFLMVFMALCYRAISTTGAMSEAPIFRVMDKWKGTMIIDEGDFGKSRESMGGMEKILNCGFERGKPIMRCNPNNPAEVNVFDSFGPKIMATRYEFRDKALESRCFSEIMKEGLRDDIPIELPPEFEEEALHLRNKLLMYRFRNRERVRKRSETGKIDLDLSGLPKRIRQAARPLSVILADYPVLLAKLKAFLEAKAKALVLEASETTEGYLVRMLDSMAYDKSGQAMVWDTDYNSLVELIKTASGNSKLTTNSVRSRGNSLGFKTERGWLKGIQKRRITCENALFERLKRRYIPEVKQDDPDDQDDREGGGIKEFAPNGQTLLKDGEARISTSGGVVHRPDRPIVLSEEKTGIGPHPRRDMPTPGPQKDEFRAFLRMMTDYETQWPRGNGKYETVSYLAGDECVAPLERALRWQTRGVAKILDIDVLLEAPA